MGERQDDTTPPRTSLGRVARWHVALAFGMALAACSRRSSDSPPQAAASASSPGVSPSDAITLSAVPVPRAADVSREPVCAAPGEPLVFVSPARPVWGQPLRIIAVSERRLEATLAVSFSAEGGVAVETGERYQRYDGPPYFWLVQIDKAPSGKGRAELVQTPSCGGGIAATKDISVGGRQASAPDAPRTSLWATRRAWSPSLENLYAAFVQHLFDASLDVQPTWASLHEVLRDPSRNFLADHFGRAEDDQGIVIRPDCADLPYFLRAYFAFKLGLPFGWSRCSRGEDGRAPRCGELATNEEPFPPVDGRAQPRPTWADPDRPREGAWEKNEVRFGEFLRTTLADAVQSGAGRTAAEDQESDYYPVPVSGDTLRPGTIFADPYGHVMVVAARIAQTSAAAGVLLAVDAQPDGTVARKRFWRGTFLFAIDPALGSAGFKRFRPLVRDRSTGVLRRAKNADVADLSVTDQYAGGVDGFYDKVDAVLSPAPLDATQALLETIQAFQEQVEMRVVSVDNGRKFLASGKGVVPMPDDAKIFETTGDWEDFSTPSRDLRLLIAIDVARAIPARVSQHPQRFRVSRGAPSADPIRDDLDQRLLRELRTRKFTYVRSDGSAWELSLEDVVHRQDAFEVAYDPNDCAEHRWGAPEGSDEASTCHARAPAAQLDRMQAFRQYFHERRRPPR